MKEINLRKLYPYYTEDLIVPVPDEVADLLQEMNRAEDAYRIRTYRHKAIYSLELLNEFREVASNDLLPEELLEQQGMKELLYKGLESLPDKQRRRVTAYYFLGMSKREIAQAEGCDPAAVVRSIDRATSVQPQTSQWGQPGENRAGLRYHESVSQHSSDTFPGRGRVANTANELKSDFYLS